MLVLEFLGNYLVELMFVEYGFLLFLLFMIVVFCVYLVRVMLDLLRCLWDVIL